MLLLLITLLLINVAAIDYIVVDKVFVHWFVVWPTAKSTAKTIFSCAGLPTEVEAILPVRLSPRAFGKGSYIYTFKHITHID